MAAIPAAFTAQYQTHWSGHVALLSPGNVPSVDFYLSPRFAQLAPSAIHRFDSRNWQKSAHKLPTGTFVIIVRHASKPWLRFLTAHAERWSGIAYFMDDDIPAAWRCRELPIDYRLRTSLRFLRIARELAGVCDRAWVSTEVLQQRYANWNPALLPPLSPFPPRPAAASGVRRWCYHGTRAHVDEMRWLKPVVMAVQQQVPDAEFEVMGGTGIKRLFRGIPRVSVLAPMSWQDYVAHCRYGEISVGVAPLLPGHFNAARAHVKIFDITHCGAVGVYSRQAPYFPALSSAGAVFAEDDQTAWSKQITALLLHDDRRQQRYSQAVEWIASQPCMPSLHDLIT